MNHDELGDLFSPHEKHSFNDGFDELLEEASKNHQNENDLIDQGHLQGEMNGQDQYSGSQFYMPKAERQDNVSGVPQWLQNSKILPGLSGFINLEDLKRGSYGAEDDFRQSGFDRMDVNDIIPHDANLNLNQFFDGPESHQEYQRNLIKQNSSNGSPNINNANLQVQGQISQNMSQGQQQHQTQPQNAQNAMKMSFFKEYLPKILDHHWEEIIKNNGEFKEFEHNFDVHGNIENILFLEENRDDCGDHFQTIFNQNSQNLMNKFRTIVEATTCTPELLIKILYECMCNMLFDLFNFSKMCDGQFCFALMKSKSKKRHIDNAQHLLNLHQENESHSMLGQHHTGGENIQIPHSPFVANLDHTELDLHTSNLNNFIVPSSKSQMQMNNNDNELIHEENKREVMPLDHQFDSQDDKLNSGGGHIQFEGSSYNNNVHKEEPPPPGGMNMEGGNSNNNSMMNPSLSEVESSQYSEKTTSRRFWSSKETQALEKLILRFPHGIPMEKIREFASINNRSTSSIQSKINKYRTLLRENRQSGDNMGGFENGNGGGAIGAESIAQALVGENSSEIYSQSNQSQYSSRSEGNIEKLICAALYQMDGKIGTKDQITAKVEELFYNSGAASESQKNSIAQHLSSSGYFLKIKGTYGLKYPQYALYDISETKSMKKRLLYILSGLPDQRGDIDSIRKIYLETFRNTIKQSQEDTWGKSLVKILSQNQEFDCSHSKMRYKLNTQMQSGMKHEQFWKSVMSLNAGQLC